MEVFPEVLVIILGMMIIEVFALNISNDDNGSLHRGACDDIRNDDNGSPL